MQPQAYPELPDEIVETRTEGGSVITHRHNVRVAECDKGIYVASTRGGLVEHQTVKLFAKETAWVEQAVTR